MLRAPLTVFSGFFQLFSQPSQVVFSQPKNSIDFSASAPLLWQLARLGRGRLWGKGDVSFLPLMLLQLVLFAISF